MHDEVGASSRVKDLNPDHESRSDSPLPDNNSHNSKPYQNKIY